MSIYSKLSALLTAANTKTGESDTTLTDAVQTLIDGYGQGGGGTDYLVANIDGSLTSYESDEVTAIRSEAFRGMRSLASFKCHNVTDFLGYNNGSWSTTAGNAAYCFYATALVSLAFPKINDIKTQSINSVGTTFLALDLGPTCGRIDNQGIAGNSNFNTLILRKSDGITAAGNSNILNNTKFASGGAGGTIYIPKALYDHLGDGTSLDYKAATNWSTINGYGTITWAQIEGSQYETHYADGTVIPT